MTDASEQAAIAAGWTLLDAKVGTADGLGCVSNFWWFKRTDDGVLRAESASHALEIDRNPVLRHFFHFPAWVV